MNEINELKAEIDALKNSGGYDVKPVLDEINVLSQSTDSRFLEIERTLSEKTNSQIPENVLEDVKRIGEFEMRLENLEKIAMDFSKKLEEIRPAFEREGNFDKIDMINKEAEERLHESQESEENLRRLASEVRAEHDGLSERLDRVKNMEGEFNRVTAIVNMLRKEVDENRIEILQRVRMDDIDKKLKEIGRNISVQRPQDYSIVERIRLLEDRYMKLSNKLEEKRLKISHEDASEFVGLTKDMARIFEKIDQLDKKINSYDESSTKAMISDIKSKIAYFENRLNEIERMFKSNQKEKPMPMIIE